MQFSVSVIIPVYNAERFIEKAISSVLKQPEVLEILVVNDGSTDRTLNIIENLQLIHSRVQVFHHKNSANKGRSASRNLGIRRATCNYIAFLDADDFYLQNRFTKDKNIFKENSNTDGVYNAIGAHFYRKTSLEDQKRLELCSVAEKVNPDNLFEVLLIGNKGYFSIDGLTVKKSIFDVVGFFQENLVVSEDTDLIWKMALKCRLETGVIDQPLAIRGVHDNNVFNQEDLYKTYRMKMLESLIFWSSKNKISRSMIDLLLKKLWLYRYKEKNGLVINTLYWSYLFISAPRLINTNLWIKYFPLIRLRKKMFPFLFP